MSYTKKERERYNEERQRVCDKLDLKKSQYNYLRRQGERLHNIYERECNGELTERQYERWTKEIEKSVYGYLKRKKKALFVFFQTDPRGATVYLDTKEIPRNNYSQACCIY